MTDEHVPYYSTYRRLRVPVWATDREVIAAALKKVRKAHRRRRASREGRHEYLRAILTHHHRERAFCLRHRL